VTFGLRRLDGRHQPCRSFRRRRLVRGDTGCPPPQYLTPLDAARA